MCVCVSVCLYVCINFVSEKGILMLYIMIIQQQCFNC